MSSHPHAPVNIHRPVEAYNTATGETVPVTSLQKVTQHTYCTRQVRHPDGEPVYFSAETGEATPTPWHFRNVPASAPKSSPIDFSAPWLLAYNRDPKKPPVRIDDLRQHADGDWFTSLLHPRTMIYFNPITGVSWNGDWTLRNAAKPDTRLPLEAYNHATGETRSITDCHRYDDEFWYTNQLSQDGDIDYFSKENGVVVGDSRWQLRNLIVPPTVQLTLTLSTTSEGDLRLHAEGLGVGLASTGAFGSVESARASIPGMVEKWYNFYTSRQEIADSES